jgi:hypothetical protein
MSNTVETFGEWNNLARRFARLGNTEMVIDCLQRCLAANEVIPAHPNAVADVRERLAALVK